MAFYANKLKQLRKEKGLTQRELAEKIGLGKSAIGMYESGKRTPEFETLEMICDFFNVNMDLLSDVKTPAPAPEKEITLSQHDRSMMEAYHNATEREKTIVDMTLEPFTPRNFVLNFLKEKGIYAVYFDENCSSEKGDFIYMSIFKFDTEHYDMNSVPSGHLLSLEPLYREIQNIVNADSAEKDALWNSFYSKHFNLEIAADKGMPLIEKNLTLNVPPAVAKKHMDKTIAEIKKEAGVKVIEPDEVEVAQ